MTENLEQISFNKIDGTPATLGDWAGQVRLVVNVASKCGLTPQYEDLEELYKTFGPRGLVVLGFPANDFGSQEPGTNAEIAEFCTVKFGVSFPMFQKLSVKGSDQHPFYATLTAAMPIAAAKSEDLRNRLAQHGMAPSSESEVLWNFEKFLIDRDGSVIGRFAPDVTTKDALLLSAIRGAL
jgi:glutathione peroxidase